MANKDLNNIVRMISTDMTSLLAELLESAAVGAPLAPVAVGAFVGPGVLGSETTSFNFWPPPKQCPETSHTKYVVPVPVIVCTYSPEVLVSAPVPATTALSIVQASYSS